MQQALNNYSYYVLCGFLYSLTHKLDGETFGWTTEFRFRFQQKKSPYSLRSLILESDSGPFAKAYLNWLPGGRPRPLNSQVISLHQSAL